MILRPFEYSSPHSLQEACKILEQHDDAKILAGGQSLLPIMKLNMTEITHLVDIKRIPNLSFIEVSKDHKSLIVGALTTHSEVACSDIVKSVLPLLAETESSIGHPLVRNRGTIGGSISHCDPSGDLCVTSLALDASMTVAKIRQFQKSSFCQGFLSGYVYYSAGEGRDTGEDIVSNSSAGNGLRLRETYSGTRRLSACCRERCSADGEQKVRRRS